MANRTETIKVRVTPGRKKEFERYLEMTGEFPSLSQLLRASATRHIREEEDGGSGDVDADEIADAMETALTDVHERLERIEQEVNRVDSAVQPDEEDIEDLADDIAVQLPLLDSGEEFRGTREVMEEREQEGMSELEFTREMSTVEFWSGFVDADMNRTRRAIARAVQWYPDVKWTYDEAMGERRYYRTSEVQ